MTEGRRYTAAIVAVVAVLLLSSLTRFTDRITDLLAVVTPPAAAPAVDTTTTTTTSASPTPGLPGFGDDTPAGPSDPGLPPPVGLPSQPFVPPDDTDGPPEVPCSSADTIATTRDALQSVDALAGGAAPDQTVVSAIAVATGCSQTDPAILLIASLIEIGQNTPDPGLGVIELPPLPFIELPPEVVAAVQPTREVLDPICGVVSTVAIVTSQVGPSYPFPLDAAFAVSLFYGLATCGQIQAA